MKLRSVSFLFALLLFSVIGFAQSSKQVAWNYSVKKIADKTYELHLKATVNGKFHIYAQEAGVEGPLPTQIEFTKSPLVQMEGKAKEIGKRITKREETWGGNVNYFEKSVDFVQTIKLKAAINTNITGKITFMVCNDNECLLPSEVNFTMPVAAK